jgi:hypothetical protein
MERNPNADVNADEKFLRAVMIGLVVLTAGAGLMTLSLIAERATAVEVIASSGG